MLLLLCMLCDSFHLDGHAHQLGLQASLGSCAGTAGRPYGRTGHINQCSACSCLLGCLELPLLADLMLHISRKLLELVACMLLG